MEFSSNNEELDTQEMNSELDKVLSSKNISLLSEYDNKELKRLISRKISESINSNESFEEYLRMLNKIYQGEVMKIKKQNSMA
jgi:hypothetical protein